ncbi:helix-turn-helix domain-containing protein [Vagococcus sp. JNUCC 83]
MIVSVIKEDLNETVAKNFRVMLAERRLKISDIYEEAELSRNTLTSLKNGKLKGIQFETIEKVSKVLEIEPYELFKPKK